MLPITVAVMVTVIGLRMPIMAMFVAVVFVAVVISPGVGLYFCG